MWLEVLTGEDAGRTLEVDRRLVLGRVKGADMILRDPRASGRHAELAPLEDVEGEVGGLLGEDDVALAADALPPRSTALVLVIEDMWAEQLATAVRSSRGRIVGGERIPRRRLQGLRTAATTEE